MPKNLNKNKGGGVPLDAFNSEDGESSILLPILNEVVLEIPKCFVYPGTSFLEANFHLCCTK